MGSAAASKAKSVLESILDWSSNRPKWQRDALRRIVQQGSLDSADIEQLVAICKAVHANNPLEEFGYIPLDRTHLPANPGAGSSVRLVAIRDVESANDLAPNQDLRFSPTGLTIIYGDNGAGKSGYARILKRACSARYPGDPLLPNIYARPVRAQAKATVTFSVGGIDQPSETWEDLGKPHPVLSAVSVFDRDCGSVHIREKNEVASKPFGLDVPDELAGACQRVKDALTAEKKLHEQSQDPVFRKPTWKPSTAVGQLLSALRYDSNLDGLLQLSSLTQDERDRLELLKEDLAKDPSKGAAEIRLRAKRIGAIISALNEARISTELSALNGIWQLHLDFVAKRNAASVAANELFSGTALAGVGTDTWRALWESARRYSELEAYPGEMFPQAEAGDSCVLCQQPLSPDAAGRMKQFESFIQNDTERAANQAEQALKSAVSSLVGKNLGFGAVRQSLKELGLVDATLSKPVVRLLAAARLRRYRLMRSIARGEGWSADQLPTVSDPTANLQTLITGLTQRAEELDKAANAKGRKALEAELWELSDRDKLSDLWPLIVVEVGRLQAIHFLDQCILDTSTTAITKVGNDIADELLTPQLRDRFQEEIVRLAATKVRVEIVRSGGKYGSPQYQIRFFASPSAKVASVLSEGEQTCVAVAAFMTELATADHQSTLVFDDPVTSLDHKWRERVTRRLVEEAIVRQIVVFTHDLLFVGDLEELAEKQKVQTQTLTVFRGPSGAGMVETGLPWIGQRVEARLDFLEKEGRRLRDLYDANNEPEYHQQVRVFYSSLRATWERALQEVAFSGVVQRHRDYINTRSLMKVSVLTETDCETFDLHFQKCSDITNAHDPSAGRNSAAPPPTELLEDVEALKLWVKDLRDRQKQYN